ncbi:unnamed protein product [Merluccius merluccius]
MAQNESIENSYEFDAPSHVMDFKEFDHADNADHWFGKSCATDLQLATPVRSDLPFGGAGKGNLPKAIVCPTVKADPGNTSATSPPSNIVTSWGGQAAAQNAPRAPAQNATRTLTKPSAQPRRFVTVLLV